VKLALLGPLVVSVDDGSEIAISARKQRAVVELLALRVGTVIQPSEIIDALWGEDPPETATNIAKTYVYALRKKLGQKLIETVAGGYRLCVSPDDVDAVRFERLMRSGHDAVEGNDPIRAVECFTEALALWRGEPVIDLADQLKGMAEGVRLAELRRSGEEQLFDTRLRLGEHALLIVDLEAAVNAEPLQERRWAQLMLALYRSGRQSDALHAYERLRLTLGEQLGIEPTPELKALEEAILLQKPELDWKPPLRVPPAAATKETVGPGRTRGRRHNVPTPLNAFVGRKDEALNITTRLTESRLLTLVGPGGAGKTRLAIQVSAQLTDEGPDGVWFVDLASLSDPGLVLQVIADSLGYHPQAAGLTVEGLAGFIGDRQVLVVVDNCEHVIDQAASVIERLLKGAPAAKVLATSREQLSINGEAVWPVQPMDVPTSADPESADEIWVCDSVQLFLQRAAAVDPLVDLSCEAVTVGQIVTRLEGLPLAIELAAARIDTLHPADMLSRLEHRLELLESGPQRSTPRQRSLEASIDWSYQLLDACEALVLRRASVFLGSFTIEALQAVTADVPPPDSEGWEPVVRRLGSKSLLSPVKEPGPDRYRLLDSIREFARARLQASSGEEETRVGTAHAGYYLSMGRRAGPALSGPDQARWFDTISQEMADIRVALDSLSASPQTSEDALELFGNLGRYWFVRAQPAEALSLAESLLEPDQPEISLPRARALIAGVWASVYQRPLLARKWGQEALQMAGALDESALACEASAMLAATSFFAGEPDRAIGSEAVARAHEHADPEAVGLAHMGQGLALFTVDMAAARQTLQEALDATEQSGDLLVKYVALSDLGEACREEGDLDEAEGFYRSALRVRDELGYNDSLTIAILGLVLLERREFAEARQYLLEAVEFGRRLSLQQALYPLFGLAAYCVERGALDVGAALYGFADQTSAGTGLEFLDLEAARDRNIARMQQGLGSKYESVYKSGGSLGWTEVLRLVDAVP
jgi:predicted ATPase/DNA-binding SARP family transcriptional activator